MPDELKSRYFGRGVFAAAFLLVLACGCATAPRPAETGEPLSPEAHAKHVASFQEAWDTIRATHWDREKTDEEWQALYDSIYPRIQAARTYGEYLAAMRDLISGFDQSHFSITPAAVYEGIVADSEPGGARDTSASDGRMGDGTLGIDVRVIANRVYVVRVEKDSPAAKANVGTGWEVLEAGGKSIASTLAAAADSFWNKPSLPMVQHRIAINWLSGFPGQTTPVTFRDGAGERRTLELAFDRPTGEPFRMGVFPPTYVTIDSRILEGNVGYFAFSLFMDPLRLMKAYESSIEQFRNCRGIILDIRGNGGGLPVVAMGMAGWLSNEKQKFLGTMVTRDTELRFVVNPRMRPFLGPVAVLIDGSSASAAEIFAAGLRDMGRARLFGTRTAGAVLPAHFKRLTNGDFLYYPIADYVSADGVRLEGVGVSPDEWAPHTQKSLLEGRDNALNAAWNWIVRNDGSMPVKGETS